MLPINWLNYFEVPYVNGDIVKIFYNHYSTQKYFFAEKDFENWDPKIHGPCNYIQIF